MKIRNKHIYNADQAVLATLRIEYELLGFHTALEPGHLTVFTRKKRKDKKKKRDTRPRQED